MCVGGGSVLCVCVQPSKPCIMLPRHQSNQHVLTFLPLGHPPFAGSFSHCVYLAFRPRSVSECSAPSLSLFFLFIYFFSRTWLSDADPSRVICSPGQTSPRAMRKCGRREHKGKGKVDRGVDKMPLRHLEYEARVSKFEQRQMLLIFFFSPPHKLLKLKPGSTRKKVLFTAW